MVGHYGTISGGFLFWARLEQIYYRLRIYQAACFSAGFLSRSRPLQLPLFKPSVDRRTRHVQLCPGLFDCHERMPLWVFQLLRQGSISPYLK